MEGWKNLAIRNPKVEEVALKRLEVCKDCDANNTLGEVMMASRCKDCGCFLEAKSRNVTGKCPRNKWPL
jgi:predicted Zn-ribbon and HTH transcriptional regulator